LGSDSQAASITPATLNTCSYAGSSSARGATSHKLTDQGRAVLRAALDLLMVEDQS
jgi:hypothetical protein